jgi:hypothetical protein
MTIGREARLATDGHRREARCCAGAVVDSMTASAGAIIRNNFIDASPA